MQQNTRNAHTYQHEKIQNDQQDDHDVNNYYGHHEVNGKWLWAPWSSSFELCSDAYDGAEANQLITQSQFAWPYVVTITTANFIVK